MIRWFLRILLTLVLLLGLFLAVLYPWAVRNVAGYEIGSWQVYSPGGGFWEIEPGIAPSEGPVRIYVYATVNGRLQPSEDLAVLTVTVTADGRTILATPLTFTRWPPLEDSPQSPEAIYRDLAGVVDPVDAELYRVTVGPGEVEDIDIRNVQVLLQAGAFDLDESVPPIGYGFIVFSLLGLYLTFRGRRKKESMPPRWGRG